MRKFGNYMPYSVLQYWIEIKHVRKILFKDNFPEISFACEMKGTYFRSEVPAKRCVPSALFSELMSALNVG